MVSGETSFKRPLRGLGGLMAEFPALKCWATFRRPLCGLGDGRDCLFEVLGYIQASASRTWRRGGLSV